MKEYKKNPKKYTLNEVKEELELQLKYWTQNRKIRERKTSGVYAKGATSNLISKSLKSSNLLFSAHSI